MFAPAAGIPIMLKVEDASNPGIFGEVIATTATANAWETLTYNYVGVIDPINVTYEKAVLFFNFPNAGDGSIYYWDDLKFGGAEAPMLRRPELPMLRRPELPMLRRPELPITFDDSGVDYSIADFGGTATELVDDPVNMSNTVASTVKRPGETWAGTIVADAGMESPVPFAEGSTAMSVRVRSPDVGIPVRVKVENTANGSISVETEATTALADEWEILNLDFSSHVVGTPALDVSQSYDKVVIFFNFGTAGADQTWLWDDIRFASAQSGE